MPEPTQQARVPLHDDVPPVAFLLPLGLALAWFAWPTLVGLAGVYRTDGNFSHGFLVPLISAYAAWRLRHELAPAVRRDRLPGLLPLGLGIATVLFARWYELALLPRGVIAMCLAGLGLVLVITGLAWLATGYHGVWRLRFPLGFLLLGVPVPSFLLHRVTIPLQQVAAIISTAALHATGVTVQRQGNVLQFAGGPLGVDEACSGIRSLAVLTAVVCAMVHFYRLRWRSALLLLILVVPLAVLTNAVRVFASGVFFSLGWVHLTRGGPHELLGLLTFALAIAGLGALSNLLARGPGAWEARSVAATLPGQEAPGTWEARSVAATPPRAPGSALSSFANGAFAAALALACGGAVSFLFDAHYDRLYAQAAVRLSTRKPLSTFPDHVGPYTCIRSHALSEGEFAMLDPSDRSIGTYLGPDGRQFTASILYWDPPVGRPSRRPDLLKRPHSPDWCYPAAGWTRLRALDAYCPPDVFPGEQGRVRVFERDGVANVVLYWTGVTAARNDALDQVFQRLVDIARSWSSPPLANLHTVSIAATAEDHDPAAARAAAMAFARELARILPDYGVGVRP